LIAWPKAKEGAEEPKAKEGAEEPAAKETPKEEPKPEPVPETKPVTKPGGLTLKPSFDTVFPVFHAWYISSNVLKSAGSPVSIPSFLPVTEQYPLCRANSRAKDAST
jgi:hypothetical protein